MWWLLLILLILVLVVSPARPYARSWRGRGWGHYPSGLLTLLLVILLVLLIVGLV